MIHFPNKQIQTIYYGFYNQIQLLEVLHLIKLSPLLFKWKFHRFTVIYLPLVGHSRDTISLMQSADEVINDVK